MIYSSLDGAGNDSASPKSAAAPETWSKKRMDWISNHLNSIGVVMVIAGVLVLALAQLREGAFLIDAIGRALSDFSLLKLVYSLIILSLATLLLVEVRRVWLEDQNRLGVFRYFEEGGEKADRGKEMVLRVADRHAELLRKFADVEQSDLQSEQRLVPTTGEPIEGAKNVLQDLDITFQKINVTDILARLRRWVSAPKEVVGAVSKTGESYRASIELSEDKYRLADESQIGGSMHFDGLTGIDEAAFEIACALIWLDAAQLERNIAVIGRQEFCDWTRQWSKYLNLSRKLARTGALPETDVKQVKSARKALTQAINGGASFPKFWSLRADFVELLPNEERDKLLIERQSDELEYLTRLRIDAKDRLKGGSPVEMAKAYEVLARARPAFLVESGEMKHISQTQEPEIEVEPLWKHLFELDSSKDSVRRASRATGLFRIRVNTPETSGTQYFPVMGFAIGDGLIATTSYNILEPALKASEANQVIEIPDIVEADFVFADRWPEDGDRTIKRHRIKRVHYLGEPDSAQLALLEIEGHDIAVFSPVDIDLDALKNLGLRGFVCLVGFPERDPRLPSEFIQALLGGNGAGRKRVMPGRVVSLPPANADRRFSLVDRNGIIVDASTSGGTGGAPLIDLVSGKLVGVNFAGQWQNLEDGKFAYAAPIQWLFPSEKMRAYIRQQGAKITLAGLLDQLKTVPKRSQDDVLASLTSPQDSIQGAAETQHEVTGPTPSTDGYQADFLSTEIPLPITTAADPADVSVELRYPNFSVVMNTDLNRRMAFFAAENVDGAQLTVVKRRSRFKLDPRLDVAKQLDNTLFMRNVLDRGALARRSNVGWGVDRQTAERAAEATFYYTNVTPQLNELNQRTWLQLEDELLRYVKDRKLKASFFSGPVFANDDPEYRGIKIPQAYWKILVADVEGNTTLAVGYMVLQELSVTEDEIFGRAVAFDAINSQIEISEIEALTDLDFGPLRDLPTLNFR